MIVNRKIELYLEEKKRRGEEGSQGEWEGRRYVERKEGGEEELR